MNNFWRWVIIISSILVASWYYGYDELLVKSPQSYHHWRQSDCASLTQNFREKEQPFWEPQIHALVADSGTTGKCAPSELAAYYWGIAKMASFINADESILLRGINTLLFLSGIAAFMWSLFLITKNLLWSVLSGQLLFTSPILVSYGNNFLSNAPAFGMALWALGFFTAFLIQKKKKHWRWATLFFLLAGFLKLPGLFLFFAIGGVVLLFPKSLPVLPRRDYFVSLLLVLIPILAWVLYARNYNQEHHTTYFSTTIYPVWEYSWSFIQFIFSEMIRFWWGEHFHPSTSIAFILLALALLLFRKNQQRHLYLLLVFLILEILAFFLLQYYTFMAHDYYVINMFVLPAVLLVVLADFLKRNYPKLISSPFTLILLAGLILINTYYAKSRLDFRYNNYPNNYKKEHSILYENGSAWLDEIGVAKEDTIIFIEDDSHTSLYLLDRYGWTTHKMDFKDTAKTIRFNRSEEGVLKSVENGAEYMVVHELQTLYERKYLHTFAHHLKARKNDLYVFDLKAASRNFKLPERKLIQRLQFDFEDSTSSEIIDPKHIVTDITAVSGSKVVVATPKDQYLGGTSIGPLENGMLVEVQVWIKTSFDNRVIPVIISPSGVFQEKDRVIETQNGWRLFKQELMIDAESEGEKLTIFMWNPRGAKARFDDFQISVYDKNPLLD